MNLKAATEGKADVAGKHDARRTLYLIDGHAQIFRAYYAIRGGMTSPVTGEATQAVFGFAGMLIKLFDQFRPHYVAVAIDLPGKTFRDEMYAEYKATREPPPEDFAGQEKRIFQMIRLFGIPLIGVPGAEADDVIATVCTRVLAEDNDVHIRVVSKDKDLEQLLCDRVTMFDIHTDTTIDTASLLRDKGITPLQVVEILALMGDKVDNIPGVEGVGPKTAAKLIHDFGSIDGIYQNIDQIKGKRKDNLLAAKDKLPLSRSLVQLKHDVEFDFSMEDATVSSIDAEGLVRLFREMGFNRHIGDLNRLLDERGIKVESFAIEAPSNDAFVDTLFGEVTLEAKPVEKKSGPTLTRAEATTPAGVVRTTAKDFDYRSICTSQELDELVATLKQQPMICVDTETIGLGHRSTLCGLCFAWQPGHGVYVPMCSPDPSCHMNPDEVIAKVRPLLEDPALPKCGHNLKYDLLVLRRAGINLRGELFDTMVAAYLLNLPGQGMDALALSILHHETIRIAELIGEKGRGRTQKTMEQIPLDLITPYAAEDADMTLRLYQTFITGLKDAGMEALSRDVEMPLVRVLADMEFDGIRVDPDVLDAQKDRLAGRITELRAEIFKASECEFNIDSPKQLAEVLFVHMDFKPVKRTKTGPSTDSEVLEKLALDENAKDPRSKVPRLILEYRQLTKLVNTYLEALKTSIEPETSRVHGSFHQTQTTTGRLASSDPNLQNIPIRTDIGRQVRQAFVADEGCQLISADYSQIELRILAHLSNDEALIEAFRQDHDIHAAVASQVFGVDIDKVDTTQRTHAKTINFGIIYGVTAWGLARRIENMNVEEAKNLIASYKKRFTGIDRFLDECVKFAEEKGYVQTMLGRRRNIPEIRNNSPQVRALGERLAINTVVQGSAADLIKLAMVNLHARIEKEKLPMKLLLQIHDELVVEAVTKDAPAMAKIVEAEMTAAMTLDVPLKVDYSIGDNWFEAK